MVQMEYLRKGGADFTAQWNPERARGKAPTSPKVPKKTPLLYIEAVETQEVGHLFSE